MRAFAEIETIAADRHGGAAALEERVTAHGPGHAGRAEDLPDDRWLAAFSRFVFSTGLSWNMIEAKWDGFEEAFNGFDVNRCAIMSDDDVDRLLQDKRIVRHAQKILSVRDNAVFLRDLAAEHGRPAGVVLGTWPSTDYVGLVELLRAKGSRLGGNTGPMALRYLGRDSAMFSKDMVAALIREGVIDKAPTSKKALAAVQMALNGWMKETGYGLTRISRTLALSADG
ncbi:MAG: DNA-3-methyladenine glycosylase I [Rhodobiaceae bacterium]|nr:DNA-3-methyladenine glycosylase I [Rhodobiaceae bacterium]